MWDPFRDELRALGYVEGKNVALENRTTEGIPERMVALAAELASLPVDVIVTFGTQASRAAKQATTTIPIVMISVGDPIAAGLVSNLARPGGNITGNSIVSPVLAAKRMEILKEVAPSVHRLAFLWNPDNASNLAQLSELQNSVTAFNIRLIPIEYGSASDFDRVFANMLDQRPDAVMMTGDAFHHMHIMRIMEFSMKNKLPVILQTRQDIDAGGLMSYGPNHTDHFRRAANYVHKILQGTKPGDLPVEQPVKFELVINLKTATALGLAIPPTLLARANDVIE